MTTRRRWPLAIASLSVARVPSATAFEHGAVSSADGVARQAQARSFPAGAWRARRSETRTVRSRRGARDGLRRRRRPPRATAGPTLARASATPRDVRTTALDRADSDANPVLADRTGPSHAAAQATVLPPGPVAVSEPRIIAPASASSST